MSTRSPTFSFSNDFTSEGTWSVIFSPETFLIVNLRSALSTAVTTTVACVVVVRGGRHRAGAGLRHGPALHGGRRSRERHRRHQRARAALHGTRSRILCALLFIVPLLFGFRARATPHTSQLCRETWVRETGAFDPDPASARCAKARNGSGDRGDGRSRSGRRATRPTKLPQLSRTRRACERARVAGVEPARWGRRTPARPR